MNNTEIVSALTITEVESNPAGKDSGNEWIELYSEEQISLDNYFLENGDGGIFTLNGSINGYLVIIFSGLWLDNSNETVFLKRNNEIISIVPIFADAKNNDLTFRVCEEEWEMKDSTKGEENDCENLVELNDVPIEKNIENEFVEEKIIDKQENNNSKLIKLVDSKEIKSEKIVLGKSSKVNNSEMTKSYKTRIGVIYFFIGICVLLVVLMALRKL